MIHYYKLLIPVVIVGLTCFLFTYRNNFRNTGITALRAVIAILVGWLIIVLSRIAVVHIDVALAQSQQELESIYSGDGAKNAFALLFGWIFPSFIVAITWLFYKSRRNTKS